MLMVFSITFPIFAMVVLGYVLVAMGGLKPGDMRVFGRYVMNIALPVLVFQSVASRPAAEVFQPGYMGAYLIGGLITIALGFVWFSFATDPGRRGIAVMGTTCPNSGFIGYPLMLLLYPNLAGSVLAMNMLVENAVFIPLALVLIEMGKPSGEAHPLRQVRNVLIGVIKRPLVIGIILGLVASLTGLSLPAPVMRLTGLVAASAAAPALIVIGGSLVVLPVRGNRALAGQIVLGKLIVMPLATALAVLAIMALGVPLSDDLRIAVILAAAMPMFTIYTVFSQEAGHEGVASIALLGATAASFLTLNLLLAVLI
ncbi:MAG: AEC family transporter [Maritimibacter sp.]